MEDQLVDPMATAWDSVLGLIAHGLVAVNEGGSWDQEGWGRGCLFRHIDVDLEVGGLHLSFFIF
jgi:hypothetical protein